MIRHPLAPGPAGQERGRRGRAVQWALCTGCEQRSFLLNVHFCDSRFPIFRPHGCPRRPSFSAVPLRGIDMTMLQVHAEELASRNEPNSAAPLLFLAPDEPRAPTDRLSPTKRAALIACLNGGGSLLKRRGAWAVPSGSACDKPIFGNTVADLGRDGLRTLCRRGGTASARLGAADLCHEDPMF